MKVRPQPPAVSDADDDVEPDAGQAQTIENADLDAILVDANEIEGGPAPSSAEVQAVSVANADQIKGALMLAKVMLSPAFAWWDKFDDTWSEPQIASIGQAAGAVCDLHGWNAGDALGKWAPYIALGVCTAPPVMATVQAVKAAKKAAAEAEGRPDVVTAS